MRSSLLTILLVAIIALDACGPESEHFGDCEFSSRSSCSSFTFSFINAETYENIMGTHDQLINTDSVVITNSRKDTMPHEAFQYSDGWYSIEGFSPFHEISCFNQCISDSAFTRTYYVYVGNGDTDTMEVYFAERSEEPEAFYNG
ncbi:MAG: hypothetical protein RJQ14_05075, partial [Marinoscillum sp.]